MSQVTSLATLCGPSPVQSTRPPSGDAPLSVPRSEHEAQQKDGAAKPEHLSVSLKLDNSPSHFATTELATPPATAASETMDIPTPRKPEYKPEDIGTPVCKSEECPMSSPALSERAPPDSASTSSTATTTSTTASDVASPLMKRTLSETSIAEEGGAAEIAKKGRRNGKMFQCTGFGDCKMCFTRSEHLARHIRKHTGERPFECKCGRAFSRLDNLRQHIYTVHAADPQNYQTIKQCLPVHVPKKKDSKQSLPIASQPLAPVLLPGMAPVMPVPNMAHGMAPQLMMTAGMAAQQQAQIVAGSAPPGTSPPLPNQVPSSLSQQRSVALPVGYIPATLKASPDSAQLADMAGTSNTSQGSPLQASRLPPVQFLAQHGGHAPPLVYMGDVPHLYCLPQQQLPLIPPYVTPYSYPMQLAYSPPTQGMVMKGPQPPSPPRSQATSPQVPMASMPR